ncbi:hypothetical protein F5Y05DRAFT_364040 [Hypoxylon sp. FL0543]|nr:hypothetical protein F5Y05DRAFT_364040 [Hypoxylon sp. FL0543]
MFGVSTFSVLLTGSLLGKQPVHALAPRNYYHWSGHVVGTGALKCTQSPGGPVTRSKIRTQGLLHAADFGGLNRCVPVLNCTRVAGTFWRLSLIIHCSMMNRCFYDSPMWRVPAAQFRNC